MSKHLQLVVLHLDRRIRLMFYSDAIGVVDEKDNISAKIFIRIWRLKLLAKSFVKTSPFLKQFSCRKEVYNIAKFNIIKNVL